MFRKLCSALLVCASIHALSSRSAAAQTLPTPAQAQQMLQSNPAIIQQLQQMLRGSGMSAEQIRARLRAQGYPDGLLDQYLPGAAKLDSLAIPSEDVFAAVRGLGLADSSMVDSLKGMTRVGPRCEVSSQRRRSRAQDDSAFLDTLRRALENDTTASAIRAILASRALARQQLDSGFTVFGLELFQEGSTQFDANSVQGGADPNYRFGAGDQLNLVLTGDVEKSYARLTVNRDGRIFVDQTPVSYNDFRVTFRSLVTTRKPQGVYLQADTRVPYGQVVRVLAIIRGAGIQNVGLVAAEEEAR